MLVGAGERERRGSNEGESVMVGGGISQFNNVTFNYWPAVDFIIHGSAV